MKKQFNLTREEMMMIKGGGRENAKNVFPELPEGGQEAVDGVPALPSAQNGNGNRPF